MRPGITIAHSREVSREGELVRSDVVGFIGLVPKQRWWPNARPGDFAEFPLTSYSELSSNKLKGVFDPVTRRAIKAFFTNGGRKCHLFGLCVESSQDLLVHDPFESLFDSLIDRLRANEDISLIAMPALAYLPVEFDRRGRATVLCQPVIEMLLDHCREMNNRFLILDAPRDLHDDPLRRWVKQLREKKSESAAFGAVYYPWLMNGDETMPPSGSVAGVFARVENDHAPMGVRWPPANETIEGVTHPSVELRWRESGVFADAGINPILVQPTRGVVIWGARTMSTDSRWMHINSRRIVSFISEQIRRDSEWVVFEHQRPELWKTVERMVSHRLDMMWTAGLLTGDNAGEEYLVRCDDETNPPEVRDAGQINVKVFLRPINTAEYIVVELRLG